MLAYMVLVDNVNKEKCADAYGQDNVAYMFPCRVVQAYNHASTQSI